MAELQPHDLAVAARWRRREAYTSSYSHYSSRHDSAACDESTPPFGETLLHCASYHGDAELVAKPPRRAPSLPSRRPVGLHAAPLGERGGHVETCRLRITGAPAKPPPPPRHRAARGVLKGFDKVACLLVSAGAELCGQQGGDSPMSLLLERWRRTRAAQDT